MLIQSIYTCITQLQPFTRDRKIHADAVAAAQSGIWVDIVSSLIGIQDDLLSQGRVADEGSQVKNSRRLQPLICAALTKLTSLAELDAVILRTGEALAQGSANQSLYLYRGIAALRASRADIYTEIFSDDLIREYDLRQHVKTSNFESYCDQLIREMERVVGFRPIGGACPTSQYSFDMVGAESETIAQYNAAVLTCFRDYARSAYGDDLKFEDGDLEGYTVRLHNGESLGEHIHPTSWLTCASYVRIPALDPGRLDDGAIIFARPNAEGTTTPYLRFRPEIGKLLIFPAYLPHLTKPVASQRERVSANYDVYCKPSGFPPAREVQP